MLNTVAVNLRDSPPFASLPGRRLSPADRAQFEQFFTNGTRAVTQKEFAPAAELFNRAAQLDVRYAELQFPWDEYLLAQTNLAAAREHFQLACDNDALPFRADSRINAAIRAEREKIGGEELILFDAAAALAARSDTGLCGQERFYEHVLFDFQMPPLNSQANNDRRRAGLEARIIKLNAQMTADNAPKTRQAFLQELARRPEDYFLHEEFAAFLELAGDMAAAEWQRFRDLLPQDCLGYYQERSCVACEQLRGIKQRGMKNCFC